MLLSDGETIDFAGPPTSAMEVAGPPTSAIQAQTTDTGFLNFFENIFKTGANAATTVFQNRANLPAVKPAQLPAKTNLTSLTSSAITPLLMVGAVGAAFFLMKKR